ncbi:MAG TPA: nucleoside triphosphate pyrophosphohydrolase [Clostridiaceae bacterium]|nr:nucleoside triphosphate pyrophosphohydrolase [Clostridiaceae bacterium]
MRAADVVPLLTFDNDRSIFLNAFEHYLKYDRERSNDCRDDEKSAADGCSSDAFTLKERYSVEELLDIMAFLRSDEGCPWDRVQTHESIKGNLIEEAYEAVDAIRLKDAGKLCEELGDVMMQVVFHAQIADEAGAFTFEDVVSGICRKLISRHSHLFGDDVATTPGDVLDTWEKNKRLEKGHDSIVQELKDVPISLPALMRSYKLQKRAARIGFDWPTIDGAREKIAEETRELFDEVNKATCGGESAKYSDDALLRKRIFDEAGDLLFAVVNVLRILKIDPEAALNATSEKFIRRFEMMDELARENNLELEEMTLEEMDWLWNKSKEIERE